MFALKAAQAGGALVCRRGETWGPASSFRYAPLLDPTYLHWVGYAKKGGLPYFTVFAMCYWTEIAGRSHMWRRKYIQRSTGWQKVMARTRSIVV